MKRSCEFLFFVGFLLMACSGVYGDVAINSGGLLTDYPSIQTAVNAAGAGDIIVVSTGVYHETILVAGKSVDIEGGYDHTMTNQLADAYSIIDAQRAGRVMTFYNATGDVEQLWLTGGLADCGGAILATGNTLVVGFDMAIVSNEAMVCGGGIYVDQPAWVTMGEKIACNIAGQGGGGVMAKGTFVYGGFHDSLAENSVTSGGGGGVMIDGGTFRFNFGSIESNRAEHAFHDQSQGGGVFIRDGNIVMTSGTIGENIATVGGGLWAVNSELQLQGIDLQYNEADDGGGLWASNCLINIMGRITGNQALTNGGGIWMTDSSLMSTQSPNAYVGNHAGYQGGAVYASAGTVSVADVDFELNRATYGGAIYCSSGTYVRVDQDALFNENVAYSNGGAIYAWAAGRIQIFPTTDRYNPWMPWPILFTRNRAGTAQAIGAYQSGELSITYTAIISNEQEGASGFNHVIETTHGFLNMRESVVADNDATMDIFVFASSCNVERVTIYEPDYIGGVWGSDSDVVLFNTIVWAPNTSPAIVETGTGTTDVRFCCISGDYTNGFGVINSHPRLYPNYHLTGYSPCRDTGSFSSGHIDIDGEIRTSRYDIGFDQFLDFDGDGLPDIVETGNGVWVSELITGTSTNEADSDHDQISDANEWVAGTDPTDPDSVLRMISIQPQGQDALLQWQGGETANQMVEQCVDLAQEHWTEIDFFSPPTLAFNSTTVTVQNGASYRIRVEKVW